MKKLFKIAHSLLIAGILGIALLVVMSMFPIPGNIAVKVVLSGSMEPAIPVGSVIVIKPAESYAVGDVITFGKDTKTSIPTTHRIVDVRIEGEETFFKTQGDANEDPDMSELKEGAIAGKVLITIPFLGYLIDFARQPIGFILLIIIPAACIMIDEIRKIWMEVKKMKKEKTKEGEIKSKKDPFLVDKNSGDIEDKKNEKEKEK
ncbi:MAG: signal peptidase I [Candidatus Pacebacteria bacterium]|nr:signal peptidase I [Candidatus Paceibacterota bacterium]